MRNLVCVTAIIFMVGFISCSSEPKGAEYYWGGKYKQKTSKMEATALFFMKGEIKYVEKQVGTVELNGKTYHKLVTTEESKEGAKTTINYMRLGNDGIYSRTDSSAVEQKILPLPPELGKKWSSLDKDGKMKSSEIVEIIQDVSWENKTFKNCLKVELNGQQDSYVVYAPDAGIIKLSYKESVYSLELAVLEINY